MKIIPAIDIIDGKCVRLTEGDYATTKIYHSNPLEVAKEFADNGIRYLHLVDLDGAKAGQIINWKVLETIAAKTNLEIDFGGGLKSDKDLEIAFNCGAHKITGGSIAIKQPDIFATWITRYKNRIILGADVKNKMVAVSGWTEESSMSLVQLFDKFLPLGIQETICTDISKDGKLQGPGIDLYREIREKYPQLHLIASGGISNLDDLEKCAEIGCSGVIVGKAIYEKRITLKELNKFVENVG